PRSAPVGSWCSRSAVRADATPSRVSRAGVTFPRRGSERDGWCGWWIVRPPVEPRDRPRHPAAPRSATAAIASAFVATAIAATDLPGDVASLADAALPDLVAAAGRARDAAHGARLTYSPKVFIPLTMLCRDRCGYCTFAKPPAHLVSPFLELDDVLAI